MSDLQERILWVGVAIFAAGLIGGAVNAMLSDHGFVLPRRESIPATGSGGALTAWNPGWLLNVLVGGVAAVVAWATTSSVAAIDFLSAQNANSVTLPISTLMTSLIIGIGGSKWLTSMVDKQLSQATNALLAAKPAGSEASRIAPQLALAGPLQALKLASALPDDPSIPISESPEFDFERTAQILSIGAPSDAELDRTDH